MGRLHDCPDLSVDIVCMWRGSIILIERKHKPLGLALPGGMVDWGESPETAALRELREETNLLGRIVGFIGPYGDPGRDERGHIVTLAYAVEAHHRNRIMAQDSEVKNVIAMEPGDAMAQELIADHNQILREGMALIFNRRTWGQ